MWISFWFLPNLGFIKFKLIALSFNCWGCKSDTFRFIWLIFVNLWHFSRYILMTLDIFLRSPSLGTNSDFAYLALGILLGRQFFIWSFFYLKKVFRTIWARFLPLWVFLMGMIDSAWGPSKLLAEPASNKYFFRRSLLLLRISWKLHIIWGLDSQNLLCLRLLLVCFAHVIEEHFDKSLL